MADTRDMGGALFKAREKRSEKSPDYTGRIVIGGIEYALSGWVRMPKGGGEKYIGLSVRVPKPPAEGRPARTAAEDDIPF